MYEKFGLLFLSTGPRIELSGASYGCMLTGRREPAKTKIKLGLVKLSLILTDQFD
jgi:hypothetical protein